MARGHQGGEWRAGLHPQDLEVDDHADEPEEGIQCGGCLGEDLVYLGTLGRSKHYRCRRCGCDTRVRQEG